MRPIPNNSTDLLYSGQFKQEDLEEIGRALGVSDLKMITTATLKPERVLYHACLNGIQTYVKLNGVGEAQRAKEIADLADAMYASLLPGFKESLTKSQPCLEEKRQEAAHFCEHLHAIEGGRDWNKIRYQNCWNTNDYPPRWQKKAIETYGLIRERMATDEYTPPAGESAGSLTTYWSQRNLEYKHYRDSARTQVEKHITKLFSSEQLLTMHPANQRTMTMFIGGMGSGKSAMTEYYLSGLPDDVRTDTVLHNADYLKYPLYRSAINEGVLPADHQYVGSEVQAESSNALYEGTRKRGYLARQKFHAPNVVLNSIVLGLFETQEGIASGGKIIAHHVHISPDEAIKEAEKRRAEIGRAPSADDIRWSAKASARSLLLLTQPEYKGTDITLHLYAREAGKAPQHYATIDAAHSTVTIYDNEAFKKLGETAKLAENEFTKRFADAGYSVSKAKSHVADTIRTGVIYAAK